MQLNENVAELIGAIAGDGYIYRKNKKYRIGFTGHPVTDLGYFEYLKQLIKQEWNKDGKIINRGNRIDIVINSKNACLFLTEELKIRYGEDKSLKFVMPDLIKNNEDLAKAFIRGVFDTDGTVFAVKKPGIDIPSHDGAIQFITDLNEINIKVIQQFVHTGRGIIRDFINTSLAGIIKGFEIEPICAGIIITESLIPSTIAISIMFCYG